MDCVAKAPSKSESTKKDAARKATGSKTRTKKSAARGAGKSVTTGAKKATTKKAGAKKPAKRLTSKPVAKKSPTRKPPAKKTPAKSKVTTRKPVIKKKPVTKKTPAPKTPTRKVSTRTTALTKKTASSKKGVSVKKGALKQSTPKRSPTKKPADKTAATKRKTSKKPPTKPTATTSKRAPGTSSQSGSASSGKPARKGITIVPQKPIRRTSPRRPPPPVPRIGGGGLPTLGAVFGKPLIPSGPSTTTPASLVDETKKGKKRKSPYTKRQLDKFKKILIKKRTELIGGVADLETEALKGSSGSVSHLPQHMAEQGSEAADQTLTLNLAAAERRLIKEIDDALGRILNRTYGLCEMTGKVINPERLEELPWTRYSIEAAREIERRSYRS